MLSPRTWLATATGFVLFAGAFLLWFAWAEMSVTWAEVVPGHRISIFPSELDKSCRGGKAKLYDQCSDQSRIFEATTQRAAADNKVLLVSLGAEWCIWCHVFAKYIHGETTRFTYTFGSPGAPEDRHTATIYERENQDVTKDAAALTDYVSRSIVVAHIDVQYAPNGGAVLARTGAVAFMGNSIPFIFAVDRKGRYAAHFDHDAAELRRDTDDWYRGYDRRKLLAELQRMHDAASR
jgi:Protein of unknown function, DUF255